MRLPPTRAWRFLAPLALSGLRIAAAPAQELVVIPDEILCPECEIEVEMMFELGGTGDTTNIVHTYFLPMDSRGRVYFQSVYLPGSIAVFDNLGGHIHTLGRDGEGPGEFRGLAALFVGPGDSLYAFDSNLYRLSVFSPDFQFARSARIEPPLRPHDGFVQSDGSFLISSPGRGSTAGRPLHIFAPDGRLRRTFGEMEGVAPEDLDQDVLRRHVAPAEDGGSWATHVFQYQIEHRGPEGELLKVVERESDWGPDPTIESGLPEDPSDPPPKSLVTDIQADDAGNLWILVWVADEEWKAAVENEGKEASLHDLRDTIIEVLDPTRKRVVARTRIEEVAMGFSAPGVMYTWDDRGVWDTLKLWRLGLHTNRQK